ncbi:glycosyltransferase [Staphylococcus saprophyticus]|uniref:glycosyltransferase n=1 Tax=Staphylococcus saprophyticus TaxID=29385 RepID=UPI0011A64FF3|nr:glycosyltransferase [Staphylococcus saprophyticus]MDW3990619.1 glycosyltransferase [Staphylococcus saprophyticus]
MNLLSIGHSEVGGGLQTVFRVNNSIKDEDINVITAFKSSKDNKPDIELRTLKDSKNIFSKIVSYFYIPSNYKNIKRILKNEQIDIVHIHSLSALSLSLLIALRIYKGKAKIIFSSHGYGLVCPNYSCYNYSKNSVCTKCIYKRKEARVVWNKCDKRGYIYSAIRFLDFSLRNVITNNNKMFDCIVTPSQYLKVLLEDSRFNFKKIEAVANPIENIEVSNQKKNDIISYVGRFSKEKNVDMLIKSFHELVRTSGYSHLKLQIIGEGNEKEHYNRLISKLNIKDNVYISDRFLNKKELKEKLNPSKILVLPTGSPETFGLVILEGIKFNMLPIAYNIGGQAENINKIGFGELYNKMSVDTLKDKIKLALSKYNDSTTKLEHANTIINNQFSVENYKNQMKRLYLNMLEKS